MGLGLSIFVAWSSAIVIGTLLGLAVYYIFDRADEYGESEDADDEERKENK